MKGVFSIKFQVEFEKKVNHNIITLMFLASIIPKSWQFVELGGKFVPHAGLVVHSVVSHLS